MCCAHCHIGYKYGGKHSGSDVVLMAPETRSCMCVTPRHGSAPTHRAGREPGTLAREAGALPRNAKGYSL